MLLYWFSFTNGWLARGFFDLRLTYDLFLTYGGAVGKILGNSHYLTRAREISRPLFFTIMLFNLQKLQFPHYEVLWNLSSLQLTLI